MLQSIEPPSITPLFGTPNPPSGLSGMVRRMAFKYTENDLRHWMLLLFADRVNMVEGLGEDLKRGKIPNVFAEMGMKSEFKYNGKTAIEKVVVASIVAGLGMLLWSNYRRSRDTGP